MEAELRVYIASSKDKRYLPGGQRLFKTSTYRLLSNFQPLKRIHARVNFSFHFIFYLPPPPPFYLKGRKVLSLIPPLNYCQRSTEKETITICFVTIKYSLETTKNSKRELSPDKNFGRNTDAPRSLRSNTITLSVGKLWKALRDFRCR